MKQSLIAPLLFPFLKYKANRLAKRQVLVKNFHVLLHKLGQVQVLVIDKAGILTRNEAVAEAVFIDGTILGVSGKGYDNLGTFFYEGKPVEIENHSRLHQLGKALALLNPVPIIEVTDRGICTVAGDSTQAALFVLSQKIGIIPQKVQEKYEKIHERAFEGPSYYHAHFFIEENEKGIAFVIGAPEAIFSRLKITQEAQNAWQDFLSKGLEVVAIASCILPPELLGQDINQRNEALEQQLATHLELLALCGIQDAIRPEVASMVAHARDTGIKIIMVSTEHQGAALSLAHTIGIYAKHDQAIDSIELETLSDGQLQDMIWSTTVFSRIAPHQKLRIMNALQAHDLRVAMTGTSLQDMPCFTTAHVSIALQSKAHESIKEAADIILLNASFASITNAIQEGRHIFYTARTLLIYFLSTHCAQLLILVCVSIISIVVSHHFQELPFISWPLVGIIMMVQGFFTYALAFGSNQNGFIGTKIPPKNQKLIDGALVLSIFSLALIMALGTLFVFLLYYPVNGALAGTMAWVTFIMFQMVNAYNLCCQNTSIFTRKITPNRGLGRASGATLFLLVILTEAPFFQSLFKITSVTFYQWLFTLVMSLSLILCEELRKSLVCYFYPRQSD